MPRIASGLFYGYNQGMDKKPNKNPVGRPSKYTPDMQATADTYVYRLEELRHVVPSRAGLCCFLGIDKTTSYEWEKIHPEFSNTLKIVETLQEHLALNGGLSGSMNGMIVKLVLANHGYHDKSRVDSTSSDGSMSPTRIVIESGDGNGQN